GCGAWRRTPGGTIRDLLEVRACYKPRREILRIFDDCCHHEPLITVRFGGAVDVLRESGIRAVGNAVLSQIAGAQVARHDTQRSAPRGATTATSAAGQLPIRDRRPLPGWFTALGGCAEIQQAGLRTSLSLDFTRGVVVPR